MSEEQEVKSTEPDGGTPEGTPDQPKEGVDSEYVDSLLAELEKANVKTPAQLEGHLTNARDYHKIQSERDSLANELRAMQEKIDGLSKPQPVQDDWGETPTQVGLTEEGMINALKRWDEQKQQESFYVQQKQLEAYDAIINDPDYSLVRESWEAQCKDPRFLAELNSGRKDAVGAYKELVIDTQKRMLVKASDTLKQLHGVKPVSTPHVEQVGRGGVGPEPDANDTKEIFNKVTAEVNQGRVLKEEEQLAMLDRLLKG